MYAMEVIPREKIKLTDLENDLSRDPKMLYRLLYYWKS